MVAQESIPVIGYLSGASREQDLGRLRAFREGLRDAGFLEGRNVVIEYRWANDERERLPTLAAELVVRRVAVIATTGQIAGALAAKAETSTIPIVFTTGSDPVELGLGKEPQPTRRQYHRRDHTQCAARAEAAGNPLQRNTECPRSRRAHQPAATERWCAVERDAGSRPRAGPNTGNPERQFGARL